MRYILRWAKFIAVICFSFVLSSAYSDGFYINSNKKKKNKFYTKLAGGLIVYHKFNANRIPRNDYSISAGVGYDFHKNISGEILGHFSHLKWRHSYDHMRDSQNGDLYSLFANIYIKHSLTKHIIPYLTLGFGHSFNKSRTLQHIAEPVPGTVYAPGRNINSSVWNVGVGNMVKLKDNFFIDTTYRYIYLGKIGIKQNTAGIPAETKRIKSHNISIGLVYKFY